MKTSQDKNTEKAEIKKATTAGLKASLNILDKWGASTDQAINILQLGRATYFNVKKDPTRANLNNDQIERLSYLLNMHQALRLVFDNPENVYGFMGFENNNEFFMVEPEITQPPAIIESIACPLLLSSSKTNFAGGV